MFGQCLDRNLSEVYIFVVYLAGRFLPAPRARRGIVHLRYCRKGNRKEFDNPHQESAGYFLALHLFQTPCTQACGAATPQRECRSHPAYTQVWQGCVCAPQSITLFNERGGRKVVLVCVGGGGGGEFETSTSNLRILGWDSDKHCCFCWIGSWKQGHALVKLTDFQLELR